jgi:hypothetical protein
MCEHGDGDRGGAGENEIDEGSRYEQYVVGVTEMALHRRISSRVTKRLSHTKLIRRGEEAVIVLIFFER